MGVSGLSDRAGDRVGDGQEYRARSGNNNRARTAAMHSPPTQR
jgi:hypothetical protein